MHYRTIHVFCTALLIIVLQDDQVLLSTYLNWENSLVNVIKTSFICEASSRVGVMIIAPTWIQTSYAEVLFYHTLHLQAHTHNTWK